MTDTLHQRPQIVVDAQQTLHARLLAVKAALNATGIGKTSRNREQGYDFRSVDAVLDAVGPAMTKAGIVTTLTFDSYDIQHGTVRTKNGERSITRASCRCVIFFHGEGGEVYETQGLGEASDYADKATNKAMSNAWKYAMCLALQIPFVGTGDDPEAHSPGMVDVAETIAQAKEIAGRMGLAAVGSWAKTLDDYGKTALRSSWAEIKAVAESAKPAASPDPRDSEFEMIAKSIEGGSDYSVVSGMISEYSAKHDDKPGVDNLIARAKAKWGAKS